MDGGVPHWPKGLAGTGRAPSLRLRLISLVALLATALLGLAGWAVWQAYDATREQAAQQALGTTRVMAMLVDQEFARAEALLQGMAANPAIGMGDVVAFLAAARRLDDALQGAVMAMATAPGVQIASSLHGLLAAPAGLGPGLEQVFTTGRTTISDLYPGSVTGRPTISIAMPAPSPEGGPTLHAVAITLDRARLTSVLKSQYLPTGSVASVLDRNGIIVARTEHEQESLGQQASEPLRHAIAARSEGIVHRLVSQGGEPAVLAFARAPVAGYVVAMSIPRAVFARERNAALRRLALQAAPVALVALMTALLLGVQLRGALARLSGRSNGPRLAEVEELAAALAAADRARAISEAELRDRTAWLEATQRAACVGTWDNDLTTGRARWSETMWRLFGIEPTRHAMPSTALFRALVLEEDQPRIEEAWQQAQRNGAYEVEFRIRRGDGEIRWIRTQGVMERDEDGRPCRLLGAHLDITERRALEAEREALVAQKDLLVQEMHHRVKNSLQLVQGLLLLQARGAEDAQLALRLREAAGRIVSIAAVHRRLYESSSGPQQDAADHLAGLIEDLRCSIGSGGRGLRLDATPGLRLPPERMAALGLLATELVTNALKHGQGAVTLRLIQDGPEAVLSVADEGPGFPQGFDPTRSRGLGMRVALAMARQLRGALQAEPGAGARVVVRLPVSLPPSPSRGDLAASK